MYVAFEFGHKMEKKNSLFLCRNRCLICKFHVSALNCETLANFVRIFEGVSLQSVLKAWFMLREACCY